MLAIILALTLLVSPTMALSWGPSSPCTASGNSQGQADGHPWDDGDGESTSGSGSDTGSTTPEQDPLTGSPGTGGATTAATGSGAAFIAQLTRLFVDNWTKVFGSRSVRVAAQRIR
jgi:hypothetical protein